MNDDKQPNEVTSTVSGSGKAAYPRQNILPERVIASHLRQKRRFCGLMCPPMGSAYIAEKANSTSDRA